MPDEGVSSVDSIFIDAGDDDTPDWLSEEIPDAPIVLDEADSELPEWLRMSVDETETAGISDWLREQESGGDTGWLSTPEPQAAADDMGWLAAAVDESPQPVREPVVQTENLPQGVEGAMPPWYTAAEPAATPVAQVEAAPVPTPAPAQPTPQPIVEQKPEPKPVAIISAADMQRYHDALVANPNDHEARLNLARGLGQQGSTKDSLSQYETLVEYSDKLDVVAEDLSGLMERMPQHPKVRRLLGDIYMRQGRLQEALDTYRGALNRL